LKGREGERERGRAEALLRAQLLRERAVSLLFLDRSGSDEGQKK